jgi:hypothetical protein
VGNQDFKPPYEGEDDVFTLEGDAETEKRQHLIQYALVSGFAILVVALALWGSMWLTSSRISQQALAPAVAGTAEPAAPAEPGTDAWPSAQFPDIPVYEASGYSTRLYGSRAEIGIPPLSVSGFDAYADRLADDGAQIFVRSKSLTIMSYKNVEIHLISSGSTTSVVLCGESPLQWNEPEYAAFPLPGAGTLVMAEEGVGARSRVLTYRNASSTDAQMYLARLAANDWAISEPLDLKDQTFSAVYKKANQQITVDYFSATDNFQIKLAFLG